MFQLIVKPRTAFGKRIKKRIEDSLRQNIKVLFEKFFPFRFVIHSDKKVNKVFGNALIEDILIFLIFFLLGKEELHSSQPEKVTDYHLIFLDFEDMKPFFESTVLIFGLLEEC